MQRVEAFALMYKVEMLQLTSARLDNGSLVGAEQFGKCRTYERESVILIQDVTIATLLTSHISITYQCFDRTTNANCFMCETKDTTHLWFFGEWEY